ncbi:MAG: CBS domain-containing protein [Acidimicrobiales bacterium]
MPTRPTSTGPDAPVGSLATGTVARVSPNATLTDVARKLMSVEVGALIVSSTADGVDGIISEHDIVRLVGTGADPHTVRAADVATADVMRCQRRDNVHTVASLMMLHHVRHLLVEENDEVVGIISARDVLGAYVR